MARKKRVDNKGRVLRTGEMQRASDNLYLYRYTDLTGKKKTVYASNIVELRNKEKQVQEDLQDGIDTSKGEMSLNELFRLYMKTKSDIRESTRSNYIAMWENGIENTALGRMSIAKIKQMHIRAFYADLVKQGLAENTVKLYHNLIYPALELAVSSDMIRKNPAKDCRKGVGGTKKEKTALTRAQETAMMQFVDDSDKFNQYAPMLKFALSTGLRVGELTGLRWSNVDLKQNTVCIRQQLIYKNFGDGCKFHLQELKTDAGKRDIPLTEIARESLLKQRELCFKRQSKVQEVEGVSDFVFTNSQGKPYAVNAVNLILKNIVDAYNAENKDACELPHVSAHSLRHTACTRLAESGLEPKVLQYIMGHANVSITLDTYTHLDFEQIQESMNAVQGKVKIG